MEFKLLGKFLLAAGVILIIMGIVFISNIKIPAGRLPGDIAIHRRGFHFYFPITTCIALSIILSFIFWLFSRK